MFSTVSETEIVILTKLSSANALIWPRSTLKENPLVRSVNSLPNDKILDPIKLKAFADDKLNVARMMISVLHTVENTVGKGENAGY